MPDNVFPIRKELREPVLRCQCPITTDRRFLPQPGCPLHWEPNPIVVTHLKTTPVSLYVHTSGEAA